MILFPVHSSHEKWNVALHYGIHYTVQYALFHTAQYSRLLLTENSHYAHYSYWRISRMLVCCLVKLSSKYPNSMPSNPETYSSKKDTQKTGQGVKRMGVRGGWMDKSVGGSRGVLVGTQSRRLNWSQRKSPSFFNPHPTPSFFLCNE